jgi:glycosyltransferase involved in cell wall biosynthesis
MRLAYFSPLNPQATGISDYSEELLPELARLAEVDLFVDGYSPSNPDVASWCAIHDTAEYDECQATRRYDLNVYQMGNSLHHASTYDMLGRYPGVLVLHDVLLHHFFFELSHLRHDPSIYLRELAFERGPDGVTSGLGALRGEHPPELYETPLIGRVIQASLGVIVHSQFALQKAKDSGAEYAVAIPAHISPPPHLTALDRRRTRADLQIQPHEIVFGAFGHANPPKRLGVVLRTLRRVRELIPNVRLLIVGSVDPPGWLDPLIDQLSVRDEVTITGSVEFRDFQRYISATDVGVNLRYPTAGETSASLLRIMGAGVPVIVSDVGSFSEIDAAACFKIPVDATEEDELYRAMCMLARDEDVRRTMGAVARSTILKSHSPSATAQAYIRFLESVAFRARDRARNGSWMSCPDPAQVTQLLTSSQRRDAMVNLRREVEESFTEMGLQ